MIDTLEAAYQRKAAKLMQLAEPQAQPVRVKPPKKIRDTHRKFTDDQVREARAHFAKHHSYIMVSDLLGLKRPNGVVWSMINRKTYKEVQ